MPSFVVTSSASNVTTQHITLSKQQRQPNVVVVSSPNVVLSSSSSATTTSSSNHERASPSPILVMQTAVTEERPGTPGLGIPMEMTPGKLLQMVLLHTTEYRNRKDPTTHRKKLSEQFINKACKLGFFKRALCAFKWSGEDTWLEFR